ncbi:MAG: SH3 domain-containing protein [Clostridia bacterium]|nr:SH3 domain-containing protein [Clostridia bacterium]
MKHNSLKKLAGLSAAAVLTLTASAGLAAASDSALVQGGRLNLRETPALTAKVLGQFPTGTLVEIIAAGDEWHQVEVDGQEGFMMARYLNTAMNSQTATVRTNSGIGLNLREQPDMDGAILTSVKNGSEIVVLQKGKEWSRVQAGGQEGFMATRFLNFGNAPVKPSTGKLAVVSNPRDTQVLNLRQSPSLDAKVVDYYRNGVEVTILSAGDTWHKVQVEDGKIGYMMAKYLKVTGESGSVKPFQAKVINVNGGSYVNFRKAASLSAGIISRVDVGASVTVIEHGTDWCKVIVDGTEGYMSTWFLKW